ncbi:MAG: M3 family metallopeptidase [bacterium]|nr:M3 family metallopeptidase [bacterium]
MKTKKLKPSKTHLLYVLLFSAVLLMSVSCSDTPALEPAAKTAGDNPFFSAFDTPHNVPSFDKIKVEHYLPAIEEGIKLQQQEIEAIVNNPEAPSFANTIVAINDSVGMLKIVENVFNAMKSAGNNEQMQKAAKEISPLLAKNRDDIRLNDKLFKRLKTVYEQKDQLNLTEEQQMLLEKYYKEAVRNGANLDPEKKTRLREINKELELLSLTFSNNVLAETNGYKLVIEKKEDLDGLPPAVVDAAAETAVEKKLEGKWVFTLDKPSWIPFLQFSTKRELREKIFKAYINRCDNGNEYDNNAVLTKMVALRIEKAKLLGYESFASYVLEENMAKVSKNVYDLLNKLWKPALVRTKQEAKELQAIIEKEGGKFKLQPWDWWYYAEKLKKTKYDLDDEVLRPYFKLENVRDGAFYVANKLWGVKFLPRTDIPKYHPDVQTFEVQEADGKHIGILYMDFFPRTGKNGGAWMNSLRKQFKVNGKNITPVITNNGNFTKPSGDKPSLLSFDEVSTLFHEFGHGLHGLLSDCNYRRLSGTRVSRDFVELCSQVMENWALEPEVLKVYAKHYQTGEVIPRELVDKIKKAAFFNIGFVTVEYLSACFLDMDWHTLDEIKDPAAFDVDKFETGSMNKIGLIPEIVVRYRSPYFRHIFRTRAYATGYYSYIWAEVLDADAFEAFKETSLFDAATAQAFRKNILERGGSADPMVLYKRFRGAEPKIDPILKKRGLAAREPSLRP